MAISIELWANGQLTGGAEEWWDAIEASLPADARISFPLLSRVDPYDEVVFAHDQLEPLRQETAALAAIVPEGSREMLERIVELCEKGAGSDQAELRFVGD